MMLRAMRSGKGAGRGHCIRCFDLENKEMADGTYFYYYMFHVLCIVILTIKEHKKTVGMQIRAVRNKGGAGRVSVEDLADNEGMA